MSKLKTKLEDILHTFSRETLPIIEHVDLAKESVSLDLSSTNLDLDTFDITCTNQFEEYIDAYLKTHKASVAYGGYNEVRNIYQRSNHFFESNPIKERNIHLGMDFWCKVGTSILAPIPGSIHSFKNNTNFGDYGPTIVLEHTIEGEEFYTLYGHLSLESIAHLKEGQKVDQGEVIAQLGEAPINGDYAPHLHFQIIKDMEGSFGDYKGVTSLEEREKDLLNCPDPNLLLKINGF